MILGIMQPYFFPHLGYFDLINYSNKWIIFDTVQYIRKGWMNRNRILHPQEGWQYITMPVRKHSQNTIIKDIKVNNDIDWRDYILRQMQHYKKKAPFFIEVENLVQDCFNNKEDSLSRLNTIILEKICKYLNIVFNFEYFSEMNLSIGEIKGPGDWALRISEALQAKEYVNSPGAIEYFNASDFKKIEIKLTFRDITPISYVPESYNFIPRLSILDVLLWNSPSSIKEYITNYA